MPGADRDITATLAELEHKLLELESELTSATPSPPPAPPAPAPPAPAPAPPPLPAAPPAPLAGLYDQMRELERFRETLEQSARALVDEYTRILEHLRAGAAAPVSEPAPPPPAPTATLDHGLLTVDAGPFGDIGTLGRFEQALGGLPGVRDVYVRGFEGRRAQIDVELGTPIDLAAELPAASPVRCAVRRTGPAVFVVDLEGTAGA